MEIGCGTGRHNVRLIKQGNHVTGVDLSEGMLDKAKAKINSSRVTFVHADEIVIKSALKNGFKVIDKRNILGTKELVNYSERWSNYLDMPMIQF